MTHVLWPIVVFLLFKLAGDYSTAQPVYQGSRYPSALAPLSNSDPLEGNPRSVSLSLLR